MKVQRIAAVLLAVLIFSMPAAALSDPYSEEYSLSGVGELSSALPDNAEEILREFGVDPSASGWVASLSLSRVFSYIFRMFTGAAGAPIAAGGALLAFIIIAAALPALSAGKSEISTFVTVLCSAICIAAPVWKSVSAAVSAVRAGSEFMLAFVPVFAGVTALSGGGVSAASTSALLLAAAEAVGAAAAFVIVPVMGSYLAMSLCSAVSPFTAENGLADGLRRAALWTLSFITTVFLGILGIQTAVNSAADTLALKTGKFIIGTAVPIAGPALSEAAAAVSASLMLLRSSVGIYGIVALAAILLPIIAELLLWRAVLLICSAAARQFSLGAADKILKAVDQMIALLIGVVLLVAAMFIISLALTVSAAGKI